MSACYLVVGLPCVWKAACDARLRLHTVLVLLYQVYGTRIAMSLRSLLCCHVYRVPSTPVYRRTGTRVVRCWHVHIYTSSTSTSGHCVSQALRTGSRNVYSYTYDTFPSPGVLLQAGQSSCSCCFLAGGSPSQLHCYRGDKKRPLLQVAVR